MNQLIHVLLVANYHQMLIRLKNVIGGRQNLSVVAVLHADDAHVVLGAEV